MSQKIDPKELPRDTSLEGRDLTIIPFYIEAGHFEEANVVAISDVQGRAALYVPLRLLTAAELERAGAFSALLPGCGSARID